MFVSRCQQTCYPQACCKLFQQVCQITLILTDLLQLDQIETFVGSLQMQLLYEVFKPYYGRFISNKTVTLIFCGWEGGGGVEGRAKRKYMNIHSHSTHSTPSWGVCFIDDSAQTFLVLLAIYCCFSQLAWIWFSFGILQMENRHVPTKPNDNTREGNQFAHAVYKF